MGINPYTKDKTMMWVKDETHKIVRDIAIHRGMKIYVYLDYLIKLGLEADRKKNAK
jgi:hypothetical protein